MVPYGPLRSLAVITQTVVLGLFLFVCHFSASVFSQSLLFYKQTCNQRWTGGGVLKRTG